MGSTQLYTKCTKCKNILISPGELDTQCYNYDPKIYGYYVLQTEKVNSRPYFQSIENYGIWWDGTEFWWIGLASNKGRQYGYARTGFPMTLNWAGATHCPHRIPKIRLADIRKKCKLQK